MSKSDPPDRGAAKRRSMITQLLISELNSIDPRTQVTKAQMMVLRLVTLATSEVPDMSAIKEVYDRVEGKARQPLDVSHDGEFTVKSAAVSLLAELVADANRRDTDQSGTDILPN